MGLFSTKTSAVNQEDLSFGEISQICSNVKPIPVFAGRPNGNATSAEVWPHRFHIDHSGNILLSHLLDNDQNNLFCVINNSKSCSLSCGMSCVLIESSFYAPVGKRVEESFKAVHR